MGVWKSDEKQLIFASLISSSKIILFEKQYQAFDTVFHHEMKHLELRQKYTAARRIFNSLLSVDEILLFMVDILHGTLRFLFLSHLLYGICVKIFIMNRYILKSYTTTKNTIDRQQTERGQL